MEQMELFNDLVPIQKYLHVWTEAERTARIKNPAEDARENPENRGEEDGIQAVCQRITQPSSASHRSGSGKCQAVSREALHAIAATRKPE